MPVPCEGATDCGDGVENGHDAERFAASDALAEDTGAHGADDGSDEADKDGDPQGESCEVVDVGELLGGSGDDGGVEAEEKTTKGATRVLRSR